MKTTQHKTHGGKRKGAGRKSRSFHGLPELQPLSVRLEPADLQRFREYCRGKGISQAEQIKQWIRRAR